MGRKILNRKELREENEAAERQDTEKKKKVKKAAKTTNPRQGCQGGAVEGFLGRFQPVFDPGYSVRVQRTPESPTEGRGLEQVAEESTFRPTCQESHRGVGVRRRRRGGWPSEGVLGPVHHGWLLTVG